MSANTQHVVLGRLPDFCGVWLLHEELHGLDEPHLLYAAAGHHVSNTDTALCGVKPRQLLMWFSVLRAGVAPVSMDVCSSCVEQLELSTC